MSRPDSKFNGWYLPDYSNRPGPNTQGEKIAYGGDMHGRDKILKVRLNDLLKRRPNHLILTGDIAGSNVDTGFKYEYYELVNPLRPVLTSNPDISDQDLMGQVVYRPQETLKDRYIRLKRFELGLRGYPDEDIAKSVVAMKDPDIAQGIRQTYDPARGITMYGQWVAGCLDVQVRQAVLDTVGPEIKELAGYLEPFIQTGTKVCVVEGNWDPVNRGGFSKMAGSGVKLFDGLGHLESMGAAVFRTPGAFETPTTVQVMWPIYSLVDGSISDAELAEIDTVVRKGRRSGKPVMHTAHIEPDWSTHFLHIPGASYGSCYTRAGENFRQLLGRFGAAEIIYGHQHNKRRDEDGIEIDPNAKYLLEINEEVGTQLVRDLPKDSQYYRDKILASYLPLRELATVIVPDHPRQRELTIHGGSRQPVFVGGF